MTMSATSRARLIRTFVYPSPGTWAAGPCTGNSPEGAGTPPKSNEILLRRRVRPVSQVLRRPAREPSLGRTTGRRPCQKAVLQVEPPDVRLRKVGRAWLVFHVKQSR